MLHEMLVSWRRVIRGEWLTCCGAATNAAGGIMSHVLSYRNKNEFHPSLKGLKVVYLVQ